MLPQAKLDEIDVAHIIKLMEYRTELRRQAATLTNEQIAKKFGVHVRTIDRISQRAGWIHV